MLDVSSERRITGLGLGVVSQTTEEEREPHNDFVRALAELGIIGLLAYIALLAVLVGRAVRGVWPGHSRGDPIVEGISEGFAALTAALLLASVTGNLMTQLVLLWYVLAFAVLSKARGGHRPAIIALPRAHV